MKKVGYFLLLLMLLSVSSCGSKSNKIKNPKHPPIQNPDGMYFEDDPDFVKSYLGYLKKISKMQKEKDEDSMMNSIANIESIDSIKGAKVVDDHDTGWNVDTVNNNKRSRSVIKRNGIGVFNSKKSSIFSKSNIIVDDINDQGKKSNIKKKVHFLSKNSMKDVNDQGEKSNVKKKIHFLSKNSMKDVNDQGEKSNVKKKIHFLSKNSNKNELNESDSLKKNKKRKQFLTKDHSEDQNGKNIPRILSKFVVGSKKSASDKLKNDGFDNKTHSNLKNVSGSQDEKDKKINNDVDVKNNENDKELDNKKRSNLKNVSGSQDEKDKKINSNLNEKSKSNDVVKIDDSERLSSNNDKVVDNKDCTVDHKFDRNYLYVAPSAEHDKIVLPKLKKYKFDS